MSTSISKVGTKAMIILMIVITNDIYWRGIAKDVIAVIKNWCLGEIVKKL